MSDDALSILLLILLGAWILFSVLDVIPAWALLAVEVVVISAYIGWTLTWIAGAKTRREAVFPLGMLVLLSILLASAVIALLR